MRVLLSNDDGILAPGILAMYRALAADSTMSVKVVAPETVQSASAHSITIRHPLLCRPIHVADEFHGTSVEGSPADCVKLAINTLMPERPDLVVSGINSGANAGIHVLYSGTVAAAAEGAILGCPAVAVSLEFSDEMNFVRASLLAKQVIDAIVARRPNPGELFNINIPALRPGWPLGVRVARQSTKTFDEHFEKRRTPGGQDYYWLAGDFGNLNDKQGTDLTALREGYICVTPLHFDLTNTDRLERMQDWHWPTPARA